MRVCVSFLCAKFMWLCGSALWYVINVMSMVYVCVICGVCVCVICGVCVCVCVCV